MKRLIFLLLAIAGCEQPLPRPIEPADVAPGASSPAPAAKPVLYFFHAKWCGPCRAMESQTFADARVKLALERFEVFRWDADADAAFLKQRSIRSLPTCVIYTAERNEVKRIVGYRDADAFLAFLTTAP